MSAARTAHLVLKVLFNFEVEQMHQISRMCCQKKGIWTTHSFKVIQNTHLWHLINSVCSVFEFLSLTFLLQCSKWSLQCFYQRSSGFPVKQTSDFKFKEKHLSAQLDESSWRRRCFGFSANTQPKSWNYTKCLLSSSWIPDMSSRASGIHCVCVKVLTVFRGES